MHANRGEERHRSAAWISVTHSNLQRSLAVRRVLMRKCISVEMEMLGHKRAQDDN